MKHIRVLKAVAMAVVVVLAVAVPSALASGTAPKVSVRVEGVSKTLLGARTVQTKSGGYSRAGHPVKYSTALGALSLATSKKWGGSWDSKYGEWELTKILGESHSFSSKYAWAFYVNNVQASTGVSELKVKSGQQIVLAALPDADYDQELLGITGPKSVKVGAKVTLKFVAYNAKGQAKPFKHGTSSSVTGSAAGSTAKAFAGAGGSGVQFRAVKAGRVKVTVSKHGFVRDEVTVIVKKA